MGMLMAMTMLEMEKKKKISEEQKEETAKEPLIKEIERKPRRKKADNDTGRED